MHIAQCTPQSKTQKNCETLIDILHKKFKRLGTLLKTKRKALTPL